MRHQLGRRVKKIAGGWAARLRGGGDDSFAHGRASWSQRRVTRARLDMSGDLAVAFDRGDPGLDPSVPRGVPRTAPRFGWWLVAAEVALVGVEEHVGGAFLVPADLGQQGADRRTHSRDRVRVPGGEPGLEAHRCDGCGQLVAVPG